MSIDLEYVKQKMLERGATKNQVESKLVPMIVSIFADSEGLASEVVLGEADKVKRAADSELGEAERLKHEVEADKKFIESESEKFRKKEEELNKLKSSVFALETPSARDRARLGYEFRKAYFEDARYKPDLYARYLTALGKIMDMSRPEEAKGKPKIIDLDDEPSFDDDFKEDRDWKWR